MAKKLGYLREMKICLHSPTILQSCSCFDCTVNKSYELRRKKLPQTFDRGEDLACRSFKKKKLRHVGAWRLPRTKTPKPLKQIP